MERLCKCGCGKEVTSKREATVYLQGHNKFGVKPVFSDEARRKMSESHVGKKHPPRSAETRRKIAESRIGKKLSPESIEKRTQTRRINGFHHTEETKLRLSIAGSKRTHTKETKKKLRQAWMDGRMICNFPSNWSTPAVYKGIQMRSKLETNVARRLDEDGILWEYEPQRFDLGEFTYLPDFYLPEIDWYLEAKGPDQGLEKVEAFRKTGRNIMIVRDTKFILPGAEHG